jgi:uncharacterized SAM-binding protein YcdF (DUF218 family)
MDWLFEFRQILKLALLPPNSLVLGALLGLWWYRRRPWARGLTWACVSLLLVTSTPVVSQWLIGQLEAAYPPVNAASLQGKAGAIVVLGGGQRLGALEDPDLHAPSQETLERLAHAAQLARQLQLPLLVTGGMIAPATVSEAQSMADALKDQFGIPVKWLEKSSFTTHENAALSAPILKNSGVSSIVLVTSASHMLRSVRAFENQGIKVHPAPSGYSATTPVIWRSFVPSARGASRFSAAIHEWLGMLWYKL